MGAQEGGSFDKLRMSEDTGGYLYCYDLATTQSDWTWFSVRTERP